MLAAFVHEIVLPPARGEVAVLSGLMEQVPGRAPPVGADRQQVAGVGIHDRRPRGSLASRVSPPCGGRLPLDRDYRRSKGTRRCY